MATKAVLTAEFAPLDKCLLELLPNIEIGCEGASSVASLQLVERGDGGKTSDPPRYSILGGPGLNILNPSKKSSLREGARFRLRIRARHQGCVTEFPVEAVLNHDSESHLVFGAADFRELCFVMKPWKAFRRLGVIKFTDQKGQRWQVDPALATAQKAKEDEIDELMIKRDFPAQLAQRVQSVSTQSPPTQQSHHAQNAQHLQTQQNPQTSQIQQPSAGQSNQLGQNAQQGP